MEVLADRPAPAVGDDEAPDALRMPAGEVEADGPAPVVHEQGDAANVETVEQGGEPEGVAFRMMVLAPGAARREAEADMVGRDAAEFRPELPDYMAEFERPGRVAVHEDEGIARALVDVMHPVVGRRGKEPALEGVKFVRNPVRTARRPAPAHPAHNASSFARHPVQPCTCSLRASFRANRECVRVTRVFALAACSNSTVSSVSTSLPSQRQV